MAYVPIVLPGDLVTHIYPNILCEITRNGGDVLVDTLPLTGDALTLATTAIDTAIQEAKMYLTRYDLLQIFGDQPTDVAANFTPDNALLDIIKTLAIWQIILLSNANVSYEAWQARYDSKIAILKNIQKGIADPRWPYQNDTNTVTVPATEVYVVSNCKSDNYY